MEHSVWGHFLRRKYDGWCEICGGTHYTESCNAYRGYSTHNSHDCYPNPQPQEEIDRQAIRELQKAQIKLLNNMKWFKRVEKKNEESNTPSLHDMIQKNKAILDQIQEDRRNSMAWVYEHLQYFRSYNAKCERERETSSSSLQESQLEPEIIMDDSVPPLVQQSQISESLSYGMDPYASGVWSDEEEEAIDEANFLKYLESRKNVVVDDQEVEDSMVKTSPWEEEFGDELDNLPFFEESREFDPVGELEVLEALLAEKSTIGIQQSPEILEELVEEEKHHSQPEGKIKDETPLKSTEPREKATKRKEMDPNQLKVLGWYQKKRRTKTVKFVNNHSPHYLPRIRFGPGKFKYWRPDPFESFKMYFNSINKIFLSNKERVELNGLDRVCIKEKPPD
ncbi:hypothetical protein R6Q57_001862 [Mikania cordata]